MVTIMFNYITCIFQNWIQVNYPSHPNKTARKNESLVRRLQTIKYLS